MDQFVVQLKLRRKRGFLQQLVGLALFALTAIAWYAMHNIDGGIVMTVLSSSICMIGGIGIFGRGTLQITQSTRRLRAVDEMRRLPVARIRQLP